MRPKNNKYTHKIGTACKTVNHVGATPLLQRVAVETAVESGLEQHITGVMQRIDAILVRSHPEGEIFAGTYSCGLAQTEVGGKAGFFLGHQWDGQED